MSDTIKVGQVVSLGGCQYRVLWIGETVLGYRACIGYLEGPLVKWVDAIDLQ
mgnify:CR=1 FL=1